MMVPVLRPLLLWSAMALLGGCAIHQSIGKSVGPFLHPVEGHDFVHLDNSQWDSNRHAMFYFYRPFSQWAADEVESPSFYIDDVHYFNLRAPGYTWLEVYPGERHLIIRRPLLGLEGVTSPLLVFDLSRIADATLEAKAGEIYYFRYSEMEPPQAVHPDLPEGSPLRQGDLTLVPRDVAMQEIVDTKFLTADLLAPNHAAISIVEANRETNYERERERLEQGREEEIEALREAGHYREASWYWPFGGGPTQPLEADARIEALNKSREEYLAQKAAEEGSHWWWPF